MSTNTKTLIQAHFGQTAHHYASAAIHALGQDLHWLIESVPLTGQERVLDIGTGAGHAAFAFAPHVQVVQGIDITPPMLIQAELGAEERGLTNVRFSLGDAESIPRDDSTYDIVVSRWCAHHYLHIRQALAEIARVLKPNGVFLLIDSYSPAQARLDTFLNTLETLRDTGHVRNYSIQEWLSMSEQVGLHGEVLHEWRLRLDGPNWVERIQTPPVYVGAIRALLAEADHETRQAIHITDESPAHPWGFDLPAFLMRASKMS
jgi:ubiquinone/menaquinone biosynthesis C-methylase UbiE